MDGMLYALCIVFVGFLIGVPLIYIIIRIFTPFGERRIDYITDKIKEIIDHSRK